MSSAANDKLIQSLKREYKPSISTSDNQEEPQWKPVYSDMQAQFSQKAVDMKIGLDVAWLASKNVVGTIILFGCDTDYIPAMKHARREGCRIAIACFQSARQPERPDLHPELLEHADECRVMRYEAGGFTQISSVH